MKYYNDNHPSSSGGGIGFIRLLTIVFIVLKLIGVIDWSWIWVLAPLWINLILVVVVIIILVFVFKKYDFGKW